MGDNIDKNFKPKFRCIDKQTVSVHYFHYFAALDRINLSGYSDVPTRFYYMPTNKLPLDILLPTSSDNQILVRNFAVLVSRILVKYIKFFEQSFDGVVVNHIRHEYSKEMATKSETVSYCLCMNNDLLIYLQYVNNSDLRFRYFIIGTFGSNIKK